MTYNKHISIKQIIAKVLTDNDIQEETHRISDMMEWAAEAILRIGAFPELEVKVTGKEGEPFIELQDYQAQLPDGLHSIIQVAYAEPGNETGPYYPMRKSSGSFESKRGITTTAGVEDERLNQTSFTHDLTYVLTPNYIKTNTKEGLIMMSYRTIPVDDDGLPTIPDDSGFVDAVYWYITMKLLYPRWASGRVRDAVYFNARQSWNFYSKQAYANAMMPDADTMDSIRNTWLRLVPELGDKNNFYSTTGERQEIRNQTNRLSYLNTPSYGNHYPNIL